MHTLPETSKDTYLVSMRKKNADSWGHSGGMIHPKLPPADIETYVVLREQ